MFQKGDIIVITELGKLEDFHVQVFVEETKLACRTLIVCKDTKTGNTCCYHADGYRFMKVEDYIRSYHHLANEIRAVIEECRT